MLRRSIAALISTFFLGACATEPLTPEAYVFEPNWGYLVVTKDTPQTTMQRMELCLLDENGGYTISVANGFNDCHPRQARGTPGRAISLSTSEGSVLTDRRIQMPEGRTAHILPYSPFNQLAIRFNPLPGRYAIAAFGFKETARVLTGEVAMLDLDTRDIVYIGHIAPDQSLVWQDPGTLVDTLMRVPGFSKARYRQTPAPTMTVTCTGQSTPKISCQAR